MFKKIIFLCWVCWSSISIVQAQTIPDSLIIRGDEIERHAPVESLPIDTTQEKHSPRKAAIRSAIIPGWGQVYNKKYWKVPIVYTAIGIPAYLYIDNQKWYNKTRYALAVIQSGTTNADSLSRVDPQLQWMVENKAEASVRNYRNQFRRNMDYSILYGLLMWGLNVVDATVDAHLKDFDVSDDISLKVQPAVLPGNAPGVSLVFTLKHRPRTLGQAR